MNILECPVKNLKFNPSARMQCMHGCMHFKRHPMCPPNCMDEAEISRIINTYRNSKIVYDLIEYKDDEDLAKKCGRMHEELLKLEGDTRKDGHYYAMALTSGPCALCEIKHCREPECRRPSVGRMPVCATNIDLGHLFSEILALPSSLTLNFWKTNLAVEYFEKECRRYFFAGIILY